MRGFRSGVVLKFLGARGFSSVVSSVSRVWVNRLSGCREQLLVSFDLCRVHRLASFDLCRIRQRFHLVISHDSIGRLKLLVAWTSGVPKRKNNKYFPGKALINLTYEIRCSQNGDQAPEVVYSFLITL